MIVSKFILTPLSSLGLCDAKLEGYEDESAPLFLCVHPNNCPYGVFAMHTQLNNNVCNQTLSFHPFFGGIFLGKYKNSNELYLPSTTDISEVEQ